MRARSLAILPPVVGHVAPDPVPHDVRVDYAALDRPAILRRAPREWRDLPAEQRAAFLELAIARWREMYGEAAEPAIEIARRCWR